MCSRYSNTSLIDALIKHFNIERATYPFIPRYNVAPTDESDVVVMSEGKRRLQLMHFGLIPHWAKDPKIAFSCLNARAETVAEKPAFQDSFKKRRCLIVTDGFYEWQREGKQKLPYRITMKNKEPFGLAGLWDTWKRPDGKEYQSFAIVTTDSAAILQPIHDRMPVIISPDNYGLWLSPDVTEAKTLLPLLNPNPSEQLDMYRVSTYVSNSSNKGAEAVLPV